MGMKLRDQAMLLVLMSFLGGMSSCDFDGSLIFEISPESSPSPDSSQSVGTASTEVTASTSSFEDGSEAGEGSAENPVTAKSCVNYKSEFFTAFASLQVSKNAGSALEKLQQLYLEDSCFKVHYDHKKCQQYLTLVQDTLDSYVVPEGCGTSTWETDPKGIANDSTIFVDGCNLNCNDEYTREEAKSAKTPYCTLLGLSANFPYYGNEFAYYEGDTVVFRRGQYALLFSEQKSRLAADGKLPPPHLRIQDAADLASTCGSCDGTYKNLDVANLVKGKSPQVTFKAYPGDEGLVTLQQAKVRQFLASPADSSSGFVTPSPLSGPSGLGFYGSEIKFENIRFVGNLNLDPEKSVVWLPASEAELQKKFNLFIQDKMNYATTGYPPVGVVLPKSHPLLSKQGSVNFPSVPPGFPVGRYYSGVGVSIYSQKVRMHRSEVLFSEGFDEAVTALCDPSNHSKPCYHSARLPGDGYRATRGISLVNGIVATETKLVCTQGIKDQFTKIPYSLLNFSKDHVNTMSSDGIRPPDLATVQWLDGYLSDCAHVSMILPEPKPGEAHLVKGNVFQNRVHTALAIDNGPAVVEENWFYGSARSVESFRANVIQAYRGKIKIRKNFMHVGSPDTVFVNYWPQPNERGDIEVEDNVAFDETGRANSFVKIDYFKPNDVNESVHVLPLTFTANSRISNNKVLGLVGSGAFDPVGLIGGLSVLVAPVDLEKNAQTTNEKGALAYPVVNWWWNHLKKTYGDSNWKKVVTDMQAQAASKSGYGLRIENNQFYTIPRKELFLERYIGNSGGACVINPSKFNDIPGAKGNQVLSEVPDAWKNEDFCMPQLHIDYSMLFAPVAEKGLPLPVGYPEAKCSP